MTFVDRRNATRVAVGRGGGGGGALADSNRIPYTLFFILSFFPLLLRAFLPLDHSLSLSLMLTRSLRPPVTSPFRSHLFSFLFPLFYRFDPNIIFGTLAGKTMKSNRGKTFEINFIVLRLPAAASRSWCFLRCGTLSPRGPPLRKVINVTI